MSKAARAARVASRQRSEVLGNGTSAATAKAITAAETGELYLIDHNHASELEITLPPIQEGAYFRFQVMTLLDENGSITINKHADTAAGEIKGTILVIDNESANTDTDVATNKDGGSATKLTLSDHIHVGTYIDVHCDGTNWQFSGLAIANNLNRVVFDA